jgi:type I restriction enzyme M protein
MRRSLGDKRRELREDQIAAILALYRAHEAGDKVRIYATTHFGFRKITVERPLRLNFRATPERIARLDDERAFQNLARSRKRNEAARRQEIEQGRKLQEAIRAGLSAMQPNLYRERGAFWRDASAALGLRIKGKLRAPVRRAILNALSERDPEAQICRVASGGRKGQPEPDTDLRDYENVPLDEDVDAYFQREVAPHVPDAWIDETVTDAKDGEVGRVGYEINFNRYFYQYRPPRPLDQIEADIRALEGEIQRLLGEVMG